MVRVYKTPNFEVWVIRDHTRICTKGTYRKHDIGRKKRSYRNTCINKKTGKWVTLSFWIWKGEPEYMKRKLRKVAKDMIRRAKRG